MPPSTAVSGCSALRALTLTLSLSLTVASGCAEFQQPGQPVGMPATAPGRRIPGATGRAIYVDARQGESTARTPVLFVHGFASNHEVWSTLEPALRRERRTVAVDLPGFGWSDRPPGDYSPAALADDLRAVLDALGIERADLVAHSWGSSVTLAFALAYPARVRRVVLMGAFVYDEQIPPFFRWAREPGIGEWLFTQLYRERPGDRAPLAFAEGTVVPQATVDAVERSYERPGTVRAALAAVRGMHLLQLEARYRTIAHPTLLLWGDEDTASRPRFGARLANELRDARLVVLPRVGHFAMFESAGATRSMVTSFLDGEGGVAQ